jgi:uncharacterized Zn finger protein (UPF0148 family)
MQYSSIEQLLTMTRGGTVSGRGPTNISEAAFDSKSGDAHQIEMAKQRVLDEMRKSTERTLPPPPTPAHMTEQELTELSTGQVDQVLDAVRKKLIKRAKTGRNGSMKNIADYAQREIMHLGESNTSPGKLNTPGYAEQTPRVNKGGYSTGEFPVKTGATKQAQTMESPPTMSSRNKQNMPIGEATGSGDLVCPECGEKARRGFVKREGSMLSADPARLQHVHHDGEPLCPVMTNTGYQPALPKKKNDKQAEAKMEAAMSDADNKRGAAAAADREWDKTWKNVDSEESRLSAAKLSARTGPVGGLRKAIAEFSESKELSDTLAEYNTEAGKVSGQKVYSDPATTMNVNAAYRTDLLRLAQCGGKVAGAPGKAKPRDVKPGDPIGG